MSADVRDQVADSGGHLRQIRQAPHPPADPPEVQVSPADLRSAFDNAPIGMAVVSPAGVISSGNAALAALLGRPLRQLVGGTFFDVTHADDLPAAREACGRMQQGGARVLRHQCRFLRPDGTVLWVLVSTSRVPDRPGSPAHLIMHVEDVTDRVELEAELTHRALHDPLTGLPNRTLLVDRAAHALAAARRGPGVTSLLFLDLDGFKAVNDTHGHDVGDEVLRQFAERLIGQVRPQDTAARLGGDEFAVLCPGTDAEQARHVADRLEAVGALPFRVGPQVSVRLSAAVGVSTRSSPAPGGCPAATSGLDERGGARDVDHETLAEAAALLRHADQQMYRRKRRSAAGTDRS